MSDFLNYTISLGKDINVTIKGVIFIIVFLAAIALVLRAIKKFILRRIDKENKNVFKTAFTFTSWAIYLFFFLIAMSMVGVNITALLASAAVLLVGVGLALQTLFQDFIAGFFVLFDKTVKVGDIIEIDGEFARVEHIDLRTTRAVMLDNKVIVIPNHLYLNKSFKNWTQNGEMIRTFISVRVAHNSDIKLIEKLLYQVASENKKVVKEPAPLVIFESIDDSSFDFKLFFSVLDPFNAREPRSELLFKTIELFERNNIKIPYPQRDIHINNRQIL